jgi:hypothetical protein
MGTLLNEFGPKNLEKLRIGMRLQALRFRHDTPDTPDGVDKEIWDAGELEAWINGEGNAMEVAADYIDPPCRCCGYSRFMFSEPNDKQYHILSCWNGHFDKNPTYYGELDNRPMTEEEIQLGKQFHEELIQFLREVWRGEA